MKKIITKILIVCMLIGNSQQLFAYKMNEISNQKSLDTLIEKQTKDELEVELKLFKLQKGLVSTIEYNYNEGYSKIGNNLDKIKNTYNDNITTTKIKSDIHFTSDEITKKIIPNIGENVNVGKLYMDMNITNNKQGTESLIDSSGNFNISLFDNSLESKFDISTFSNQKQLDLLLKKMYIKTNFKYNNILKSINISPNEFEQNIGKLNNSINAINKNSLLLANKPILIKDGNNNGDILANINNVGQNNNSYFELLKKEKISQIFNLLKTEKLFLVYKMTDKNKYYLMPNNLLLKKINTVSGINIFPEITLDYVRKLENQKVNIIEQLNNGTFKYSVITKSLKNKSIDNIKYIIFNDARIHTFLYYNKDNTIFYNKDTLKIKTNNILGQFVLGDNSSIKGKIQMVYNNIISEFSLFSGEGYNSLIIDYILKNKNTNNVVGNGNFMYVKKSDKDDFRTVFNISLKGEILSMIGVKEYPYINKLGDFNIKGEGLYKNGVMGGEVNFIKTDMLPINIVGTIQVLSKVTETSNIKIHGFSNNFIYKFNNFISFFTFLTK